MTHHTILKTVTILLTCMTIWTYTKDTVSMSEEQEFCSLVDKEDLEATKPIINDYLAGLEKNKNDENLQKLVDWLESQSCVDKAEILCNSCIFTLPAQSEILVDFNFNGQTITRTMDISMEERLRCSNYH